MNDLSLEIGQIHYVGIHNADGADACCCQIQTNRCSQPSCTDYEDLGCQKFFLTHAAHFFQDDMPAVTFDLLLRKCHCPPPPMKYRNST